MMLTLLAAGLSSAIPAEFQAASLARQLVQRETIANFVTVFSENSDMPGFPYASVELYASDCVGTKGHSSGSLLIFISPLEINYQNYAKNNKVSFALRDTRNPKTDPLILHRVSMVGTIEPLPKFGSDGYQPIADCFFTRHPDAKAWEHLPSHDFRFHRFTPHYVHYVGGFGDKHYVGNITLQLYVDALETASCKAWGCSGAGLCCPYDDDNAFQSCCLPPSPAAKATAILE